MQFIIIVTTVRTAHGESKYIIQVTRCQVLLTSPFLFFFPSCIWVTFCPGRLQGHFLSNFFPVSGPHSLSWCLGLVLPSHGTWYFPWALFKSPINPFLQLVKVTLNWIAAQPSGGSTPSSFASSVKFLRVHSVPLPGH